MEKINWEDFSISHTRIREAFIFELSKTKNPDVLRHIHRRFILRFYMMESAIIEIYDKVGKSEEPLSVDLGINLTLLLNAYYLNLTGCAEIQGIGVESPHARCQSGGRVSFARTAAVFL